MDGFTYYDIFQTKGIEYIIIITFLLALIPFWVLINNRKQIATQIKKVFGILTSDILKIPKGVFYSKNHTWTHLEKSGIAEIGLNDLLLHLTGEVEIGQVRNSGDIIKKGDLLTQIVKDGKVLKIFSPISGKVVTANQEILQNKEILKSDPYSAGWIYKIEPSNWKADTKSYFIGEEATTWVKEELNRFKDFLAVSFTKNAGENATVVFQEGGELRDNLLSELPEEIWQDFQKDFLNNNE